jgi:hypothetical protein
VKGKAELHVAEKRSKVKAIADAAVMEATEKLERLKAQIRARVEHPFRVMKCQLGFTKARYLGPAKNTAQLQTLFASGESDQGAPPSGGGGMSACAGRGNNPIRGKVGSNEP